MKISGCLVFGVVLLLACNVVHAQSQIVTLSDGKQIILYEDKTWDYLEPSDAFPNSSETNRIPQFLRPGITVSKDVLKKAIEMYQQGWRYVMPRPSYSASGKTNWWFGYWYNHQSKKFSTTTPLKNRNGIFYGDEEINQGNWKRAEHPGYPTKLQWLLSRTGGVKPRD